MENKTLKTLFTLEKESRIVRTRLGTNRALRRCLNVSVLPLQRPHYFQHAANWETFLRGLWSAPPCRIEGTGTQYQPPCISEYSFKWRCTSSQWTSLKRLLELKIAILILTWSRSHSSIKSQTELYVQQNLRNTALKGIKNNWLITSSKSTGQFNICQNLCC